MLRKSLVLVPVLFAAPMADAASISYSGSVPQQVTELSNVPVVPNLKKFDTNLGTLTSVLIEYNGDGFTTDAHITSSAATSTTFKYTFGMDFSLSSTDAGVNGLLSALDFSAGFTFGPHAIDPGQTVDVPDQSYTGGEFQMFTDPGDLAKFEAVGLQDLIFQVSTLTGYGFVGGGGNLAQTQHTEALADVRITYEYTAAAIPEPSSVVMLGLAGGLLGGVSLYRKRRV